MNKLNRPARELPSLDLLKAFESAARHLSFTRAGAELFRSQSAVSRQIQQLESQLGVALFVRRTRALVLTDAGQRYYRDVAQALHQLREAGSRLRVAPDGRIVTVTTTVTFASLWLVPQLADFQRRHPDIEVRIAADNAVRDLDRDRLDVAIRYSTRGLAGAGAKRLFGERVVPVCSPRLPKRGELRRPTDLARFTWLHFDDPAQLTPWLSWDVWFEAIKVPQPRPKSMLRFSHYDMLLRAAANGQGVALGRLPLIAPLLEDGTLVAPLEEALYSASARGRAYWIVPAAGARARPEVRTFAEWVEERARALGRGDAPPVSARRPPVAA